MTQIDPAHVLDLQASRSAVSPQRILGGDSATQKVRTERNKCKSTSVENPLDKLQPPAGSNVKERPSTE